MLVLVKAANAAVPNPYATRKLLELTPVNETWAELNDTVLTTSAVGEGQAGAWVILKSSSAKSPVVFPAGMAPNERIARNRN